MNVITENVFRKTWLELGEQIVKEYGKDTPPVFIDGDQIEQVLMNNREPVQRPQRPACRLVPVGLAGGRHWDDRRGDSQTVFPALCSRQVPPPAGLELDTVAFAGLRGKGWAGRLRGSVQKCVRYALRFG